MATLAEIGDGGCIEDFPNGTVGQVLTIGADGEPAWLATADDQLAAEVPYAGAAAGTPLAGIANVEAALDAASACLVCSIISDNTCADGGIGADYMVRSATKNADGTLEINGAPEHTSIFGNIPYEFVMHPGPFLASVPGPTEVILRTESITITNPSACRSMTYYVEARTSYYLYYNNSPANNVNYVTNLRTGGALADVSTSQNPITDQLEDGAAISVATSGTIAAGASITFDVELILYVYLGQAESAQTYASMSFIAVTA